MDCYNGGFNIAITAGFYSQAAGVLAGFAFTAVLLVLTNGEILGSQARRAHAATSFICSFFALLLSTVQYAVLAGAADTLSKTNPNLGRAASEEVIAGASFGLSVLLLLYGTLQLLDGRSGYETPAGVSRAIVSFVGPSVVLLFHLAAVQDILTAKFQTAGLQACQESSVGTWGIAATLTGFLGVFLGGLFRRRVRPYLSGSKRDWLPILVLCLSAAGALGVATAEAILRSDESLSDQVIIATLFVASLSAATFSLLAGSAEPHGAGSGVPEAPDQPAPATDSNDESQETMAE